MNNQADLWQVSALFRIVTTAENVLLCCCRGAGKSETSSCAAYAEACLGGMALVFSRSDRQAKEEIFDRVLAYHRQHQLVPATRETTHDLQLANGGRVLALPCSAATTVGKHKISLLIIDEAAKVPDQLYSLATPMVGIERFPGDGPGRLVLLSTPYGQRGFFWKEWIGQGADHWRRYKFTWQQVSRIKPEFVEQYRKRHGDMMTRQEYGCEFLTAEGQYFNPQDYHQLLQEYDTDIW